MAAIEPQFDLTNFSPYQTWLRTKLAADGSNFTAWYDNVLSVLVHASKLGYVDGTFERPPQNDNRRVLFDKNVAIVRFFLMSTLSTPVMEKVFQMENSHDIMKYLLENYNTSYLMRFQEWNTQVGLLRQEKGETLLAYCVRAGTLSTMYSCKNLNMDHFDGSQSMLLIQFISGLQPGMYQIPVERIIAMDPLPSIGLACHLLLSYQNLLNDGVV